MLGWERKEADEIHLNKRTVQVIGYLARRLEVGNSGKGRNQAKTMIAIYGTG